MIVNQSDHAVLSTRSSRGAEHRDSDRGDGLQLIRGHVLPQTGQDNREALWCAPHPCDLCFKCMLKLQKIVKNKVMS